jgi:hypothetical protein
MNLIEKISEQALVMWRGVLTRATFPQINDTLKAYMTNKFSSEMTQSKRAKVIYGVMSQQKKEKKK